MPARCKWASSPALVDYHDHEWGVPLHEEERLFEMLTLEGAQAGLSWEIVLRKREGYRKAFAGFDPQKVSRFTPRRIETLLRDKGIVRNRLKVESTVNNARAFIQVQEDFGSFDRYLWAFVDGKPIVNRYRSLRDLPAQTPLSGQLSRDLKQRGFRFVGPTVCYAFMQAIGMVNDHTTRCFRYKPLIARHVGR